MPQRPPRTKRRKGWDHGGKSRHERGYGSAWVRLRNAFMAEHPVCADPFGRHPDRVVPAEECDHIVPKAFGGTDDWENLQALCCECHRHKTARERVE